MKASRVKTASGNSPRLAVSMGLPEPGLPCELMEEIALRAQRLPASFLHLVPTHRMARYFRLDLLAREDVRGFVAEPALTLEDFIQRAFIELNPDLQPVPESLKLILVESILAERRHGWRVFRSEDRQVFPGLVRSVSEGIQKLKQHRLSAEAFRRRACALRSAKYEELGKARELYDAFLAGRGLADADDMALRVAAATENRLRKGPLRDLELLVLNGFYDFSPVQLQLVEKLMRIAARVYVHLDYEPKRDRVFGPTREWLERLQAAGARVTPRAPCLAGPLRSAARQMFTTPSTERQPTPSAGALALIEARTRAEEVEIIASEIRRMQRSAEPPPLRRVLVTFAAEDAYAPLIREIFPRYGIHFNFSYGFRLHSSPVAAALLGMLDAVEARCHREAVVRFLSSPYVTFGPGHAGGLKTILDRECRAAGIVDGRETWEPKLKTHARSLRLDLERIESGASEPDDGPQTQAEKLRNVLAETEAVTDAVSEMMKRLAPLERKHTLAEFKGLLLELIEYFGIEINISRLDWRHVPLVEIEKDVRALAAFRQVLDDIELSEALTSQSGGAKAGRPQLTFAEFHALLRAAVMGAAFQVSTYDDAGVQVMGIHETRGLRFDTVFAAGMLSGEFPRPMPETVFFAGEAARKLGLTDPDRLACEQRWAMLRLLGTAERRLVVSLPLTKSGDPTVCSPFLEESLDLITDATTIQREDGLFSRADVSRWLGERLAARSQADAPRVAALLAKGPALKHMPGQVLRSVKAESRRRAWRDSPASQTEGGPWVGRLRQRELKKEIRRVLGPSHRFSVSQIEKYAACPFAFFAQYVLGLEELMAPEEEISPLTRGHVIHDALREFYTKRREAGKAAITQEEAEEACGTLAAIVTTLFERLPFDDLFWQKELEAVVKPAGLAQAIVQDELSQGGACEPRYFEFAFGRQAKMGVADPESTDAPLRLAKDVLVAGKIDRVDVSPDGKAVVVDYKARGSVLTRTAILEGRSFQLPVYLMAVREFLRVQPAAGQYFQVLNPAKCGRRIALADKASHGEGYFGGEGKGDLPCTTYAGTLDDLLADVRSRVLEMVGGIRAAAYPVTSLPPGQAGCEHCTFRRICRRAPASRPGR